MTRLDEFNLAHEAILLEYEALMAEHLGLKRWRANKYRDMLNKRFYGDRLATVMHSVMNYNPSDLQIEANALHLTDKALVLRFFDLFEQDVVQHALNRLFQLRHGASFSIA